MGALVIIFAWLIYTIRFMIAVKGHDLTIPIAVIEFVLSTFVSAICIAGMKVQEKENAAIGNTGLSMHAGIVLLVAIGYWIGSLCGVISLL